MNLRTVVTAISAAAVLTLAACGDAQDDRASAAESGKAPAGARTVTTIDDSTLTVPNGKPAAVFFFSYGCGACFTGGAAMVAARAKVGEKADFLLADLDPYETEQDIDAFRERIGGTTLPATSTDVLEMARAWQVTALSTVVVLDAEGAVTYRAVDPPAADILAALDQASGK